MEYQCGGGVCLVLSVIDGYSTNVHTVKLLQDSFHGAGTAAAAHGDVELVLVVRHFGLRGLRCWKECC